MTDLDYAKLVEPITAENPTGSEIRQSQDNYYELYLATKDIRYNLIKDEKKQIESTKTVNLDKENWHKILLNSSEIISNYSKDLEISLWLIESLVRLDNINGLADGLTFLNNLLITYGKKIYPQADDEQSEYFDTIITSIATLSGKYEMGSLIVPLYFYNIIILKDKQIYNLLLLRTQLGDLTKNTKSTTEFLQNIASKVKEPDFTDNKLALAKVNNEYKKFKQYLVQRFTIHTPDLSNLTDIIEYAYNIYVALDKIITSNSVTPVNDSSANHTEDLGEPITDSESTTTKKLDLNDIDISLDKDKALALLEKIIEFFRRTEPHSPVSYSLERALYWSKLSLAELLTEIVSEKSRANFCQITGVPFIMDNQEDEQEQQESD